MYKRQGLDTGDVGGALDELGVESVIDDQVLLACADSGQESNDGLRLVVVGGDLVDQDHVSVGRLVRQGAEQSQTLDLKNILYTFVVNKNLLQTNMYSYLLSKVLDRALNEVRCV